MRNKVSSVSVSKHTPGLQDGSRCLFDVGEPVTYRNRKGEIIRVTIDSKLKTHKDVPGDGSGYECIFPDGKRCFAARFGIIGWGGKNGIKNLS